MSIQDSSVELHLLHYRALLHWILWCTGFTLPGHHVCFNDSYILYQILNDLNDAAENHFNLTLTLTLSNQHVWYQHKHILASCLGMKHEENLEL